MFWKLIRESDQREQVYHSSLVPHCILRRYSWWNVALAWFRICLFLEIIKQRIILSRFTEIREDEVAKILSEENADELEFHQKCYDQYTHIKTLHRIQQNNVKPADDTELNNEPRTSGQRVSFRKRDRSGNRMWSFYVHDNLFSHHILLRY